MLISLHVKNLALIDETEVFFKKCLNILTGETGAGKSIIMGSVNLALGAKADKTLIRNGAEYALVELVFQTDSKEQEQILTEMDIPLEDDGMVIIMRKLMPERSLCKVNGITVSQKQLKELASLFINIHGQHDNKELLNVKRYSQILDEYSGEKLGNIKEKLKTAYAEYKKVCKELDESVVDEKERAREISLITYEIEEIENAALKNGEDEDLEEQYHKMVNSKRIAENVSVAYDCTGYTGRNAAGDSIGRAVKELKQAASYDEKVQELTEQLEEIDNLLNDFNRSLVDYQNSLEFEPGEFDLVERRLNLYNYLKDKYGNTVEEIFEYKEEKEARLQQLADYENYILNLENEKQKKYDQVIELCKELSDCRKENAVQLQEKLKNALLDLNFLSVEFEIPVIVDEQTISSDGYDDVDFIISLNPGETMKSISKVASGGELSRIMLALKSVMADKEDIGTLIFDEIDAGISGKTAWKVSEKMAVLGKEHQLICVTHLPQIAAMADAHFMIEKSAKEGRSVTEIFELQEQQILEEIARLLSGSEVTEAVISNAKELKDLATKTKQNLN
ncbi:MAG: DNA repair protein RecN [Lachnospiraceae bacterium]|nr:DNA repair protein RecN [Lachnospiraceae bacterium]